MKKLMKLTFLLLTVLVVIVLSLILFVCIFLLNLLRIILNIASRESLSTWVKFVISISHLVCNPLAFLWESWKISFVKEGKPLKLA